VSKVGEIGNTLKFSEIFFFCLPTQQATQNNVYLNPNFQIAGQMNLMSGPKVFFEVIDFIFDLSRLNHDI
jgi:hypothetical protein